MSTTASAWTSNCIRCSVGQLEMRVNGRMARRREPASSGRNQHRARHDWREPRIRDVYQFFGRVAATDSTVLIHGEVEQEQELVAACARVTRQQARRAGLYTINCAGIDGITPGK